MRSALLFLALGTAMPAAAEPTGHELVEHVERLLWGRTNQGVSEMTIVTPDWTRTLTMRFWMDRPERTLIRILAPPKDEGVGSLRLKAEMWNYLPKVERVIKIPSSMMLQSWMGSDFSNDDLVKETSILDDYTHTLRGIEVLDGVRVYRVESLPRPEAAVVWGKLVYAVRVTDRMPLKLEFFDERGELVKALSYSEFRMLGGRVIPTRWEMRPVRKPQNSTVLVLRQIRFDQPIEPEVFTLMNLKGKR